MVIEAELGQTLTLELIASTSPTAKTIISDAGGRLEGRYNGLTPSRKRLSLALGEKPLAG